MECLICGRAIVYNAEAKWQGSFHELDADPPVGRIDPPLLHVVCWNIVTSIEQIDIELLGNLADLLTDLRPLLKKITFGEEPSLERLSDTKTIAKLRSLQSGAVVVNRFSALPTELTDQIYMCLSNYIDVYHLNEATMARPSRTVWRLLGQLEKFKLDEPKADLIESLLYRIHCKPKSLPDIVNYSIIWDNAKIALDALKIHPLGQDAIFSSISNRALICQEDVSSIFKKQFLLGSSLKLHFSEVNGRSYLCGIASGDSFIGYKGTSTSAVCLNDSSGLFILSNGGCILDIQSLSCHRRTESPVVPNRVASQLSWPVQKQQDENKSITLIVVLDTVKIRGIACRYLDTIHYPVSWRDTIPDLSLTRIAAIDQQPHEMVLTIFHFNQSLSTCRYIRAWMAAEGKTLSCIEFGFSDSTEILGLKGTHTIEVLFKLDAHERIISIGYTKAARNNGISIKIITDHYRAAVFGDETVVDWKYRSSATGLYASSHDDDDRTISLLGFLCAKETSSGPCIELPNPSSTTCTTDWPCLFTEFGVLFLSSASLHSARKLTVYNKSSSTGECEHICGLGIQTPDRFSLLGEASSEYEIVDIQHLTPLTHIEVRYDDHGKDYDKDYYKKRQRVIGFRFGGSYNNHTTIGLCSAKTDVLRFQEGDDVHLYWLFSQQFSLVSFCTTASEMEAKKRRLKKSYPL